MRVSCSLAKQHLFIERLIACMDSSMPYRLRHAAIRAAHSSCEILASIDAVYYGDMVLAKLSRAILSAVCPRPGTTSGDEDPDRPFNIKRDSCYLELVFALARNPNWRPHLFEARHIDRWYRPPNHTRTIVGYIARFYYRAAVVGCDMHGMATCFLHNRG
ncbi:hypothetical protein BDR03DRAFT_940769 [Suillus americanus]|nr:hypothetical protein BDR03DRAFT_940769 [Suillus americanus]